MKKIFAALLFLMVFASPAFASHHRRHHYNHHFDHHHHHPQHHA
jgi:hypothetical protein